MLRIGLIGATGRMSSSTALEIINNPQCSLTYALVRSGNKYIGQDLGEFVGANKIGVLITDNEYDMWEKIDAIIDFSSPEVSMLMAKKCASHQKIHILGTTGINEDEQRILQDYAKDCTIIFSFNMSLGMNILLGLVKQTATILDEDFDIEIVEMHHRYKKDSPSGAAMMLGNAAAEGRDINLKQQAIFARHGNDCQRQKGEVGFSSIRGGDMIFDHTVIFAADKERIELSHKSISRDIYAKGAIKAVLWAKNKPYGFYSMQDVLFGFSK